jgi:hypothetical protein
MNKDTRAHLTLTGLLMEGLYTQNPDGLKFQSSPPLDVSGRRLAFSTAAKRAGVRNIR